MSRLHFSSLALKDLEGIHDFIAIDSAPRALRFVSKLERRCHSLIEMRERGRPREELAPSLRSTVEGNYVIFYRPTTDGVEIIRVLHGARDLRRVNFQE
jgi:toxin ParE1/3/4